MKRGRGHDKICMIEDPAMVGSLKEDPTVSCAKCGVQAHDSSDVCAPVRLSGSGSHKK